MPRVSRGVTQVVLRLAAPRIHFAYRVGLRMSVLGTLGGRMKGASRWAVAGLLLALSTGLASASERLPRPEALEPAVAFWTRIYTTVHSDEGLIHDNRALNRVYRRLELPRELSWREQRARLRAATGELRDALEALAEQDGEPRTPVERHVRSLFPRDASASSFASAAHRLRFQRGLSDRFQGGIRRSGQWLDFIRAQLGRHGVPAELAALPHVESSFRADIASHASAVGLWQFTRPTAKRFMRVDGVVDERLDPWRSSEAAARLLAANYRALGDWPRAITAYNHGVAGMRRASRDVGTAAIDRIIATYNGPYFGFASRNFYPALLAAADVERERRRHFGHIERQAPPRVMELPVPDFAEAPAVAEAAGLTLEELRRLNPALQPAVWSGRKYIPKGYRIRLPATDSAAMAARLAEIPLASRYTAQRRDTVHRVGRGDTLSAIADRYGVSVREVVATNGLRNADHLRVGQRLRLPGVGQAAVSLAELAGAAGRTAYTVRRGDTLATIASRVGVPAKRIAALNDLPNPDLIRVGQSLRLVSDGELASAVAYAPDEG